VPCVEGRSFTLRVLWVGRTISSDHATDLGEDALSFVVPAEDSPAASAPQVLAAAAEALEHLNQRASGRWEFEPVADVPGVIDLSREDRTSVPVVLEDGTLVAVMKFHNGGRRPGDDERAEVRSLAVLLAALVEAERSVQEARRRAATSAADALSDHLTGLANRRAWRQALRREEKRCERTGSPVAIAVVDLDDLKEVNDHHGHLAGDLLIKLAASTILGAVRGADLVARLGGDEFGVLAVDYEDPRASHLVLRVRRALSAADVVASVGGALHRPGTDIMRTFHQADMDMYEAKRTRKMVRAERPTRPGI
jgi:diguanylate cyclase (GGDEF)-like protein